MELSVQINEQIVILEQKTIIVLIISMIKHKATHKIHFFNDLHFHYYTYILSLSVF